MEGKEGSERGEWRVWVLGWVEQVETLCTEGKGITMMFVSRPFKKHCTLYAFFAYGMIGQMVLCQVLNHTTFF